MHERAFISLSFDGLLSPEGLHGAEQQSGMARYIIMPSLDVMANISTAVQDGLADMAFLSDFLTLGVQHDTRRNHYDI